MAKARNTDPATSHDAAASVKEITRTQLAILKALARPRTDPEMIEAYRKLKAAPVASESGLRSRREELSKMKLVAVVGEKPLASGRNGRIWQTVERMR